MVGVEELTNIKVESEMKTRWIGTSCSPFQPDNFVPCWSRRCRISKLDPFFFSLTRLKSRCTSQSKLLAFFLVWKDAILMGISPMVLRAHSIFSSSTSCWRHLVDCEVSNTRPPLLFRPCSSSSSSLFYAAKTRMSRGSCEKLGWLMVRHPFPYNFPESTS